MHRSNTLSTLSEVYFLWWCFPVDELLGRTWDNVLPVTPWQANPSAPSGCWMVGADFFFLITLKKLFWKAPYRILTNQKPSFLKVPKLKAHFRIRGVLLVAATAAPTISRSENQGCATNDPALRGDFEVTGHRVNAPPFLALFSMWFSRLWWSCFLLLAQAYCFWSYF